MSTFVAKVRALSHQGMGVVDHADGRVFFARGAWPGDEAVFGVAEGAESYDTVSIVRFLVRSQDREEIPCPHRGDAPGLCGGCPWMGIRYDAQLGAKAQRLNFLLSKNGLTPAEVRPILASPKIFGYRNRAQFKTDGAKVGYVSEGTNQIAPVEDCLILNDPLRALLQDIRHSPQLKSWAPAEGFTWSYLDVDDAQKLEDVVVNRRRPFRQGNTEQNEVMKAWITQSLAETRRDWPVLEAFCGSGNLTEALSRAGFSNIVASEVRGQAIQELEARRLPGVRLVEIDMTEKGVWQQLARRQPHAKVLLVDPPREGIEKRRGIFKYLDNLQVIIYISCEPTTWARDVKDFQQNGWKIAHVTPLDLFPHTPHVEILSYLVRA